MALDKYFKPILRFMACSDIHVKDDPDCPERARLRKAIRCAYKIAGQSESYKKLDALNLKKNTRKHSARSSTRS